MMRPRECRRGVRGGGRGGRFAGFFFSPPTSHVASPHTPHSLFNRRAYAAFDKGVARKFVIDPHGTTAAALGIKHAKV